jgi:hypothetical protein
MSNFEDLLQHLEEENRVSSSRSNRAQRVAEWSGSQDDIPIEKLMALHDLMSEFVAKRFAKVDIHEQRELSDEEKSTLMTELLDIKNIEEALESRKIAIKQMVFQHLTAQNIINDVPDPTNINGEIEVLELKKKFTREGTGYGSPSVDTTRLREILGADQWDRLVDHVLHPAWEEEVFSQEKVMAWVQEDVTRLEILRQVMIPGKIKSARFQVRDL